MPIPEEPAGDSRTPATLCPRLIEIRPRCYLDRRGAGRLILVTGSISFGAAAIVTVLGAWPVLIYVALEMVALILALRCSLRRGRDWQRFKIDGASITVTRCEAGQLDSVTLPRYWAHVTLRVPQSPLQRRRLFLECGRSQVEVGQFLNENERGRLRRTLADLVGGIGKLPALVRATPLVEVTPSRSPRQRPVLKLAKRDTGRADDGTTLSCAGKK